MERRHGRRSPGAPTPKTTTRTAPAAGERAEADLPDAPDPDEARAATRERRLTTLAAVAPLIAQLVMFAALLAMRRWLYALMLCPTIVGCLAMIGLQRVRERNRRDAEERERRRVAFARASSGPSPDSHARLPSHDGPPPDMESASLESLLALSPADDPLPWRSVARYWLEPPSLDVPVGMGTHGPFRIDLASQGPHALVAGTTGSGKSVLLRGWCLAMACRNGPDRLRFVFLDFKGGTAFRPLERLPHCVGAVSDLDVEHASRALRALERELTARETLAARHGVQDVRELDDPPPRLVVAVDEFHALRARLPDGVERLVRIASLGRALGMHVIACTQHPSAQVGADMKANMALNLCLRVRDPAQSTELLGDARATRIPPSAPGMCYLNDGERVEACRCAVARDVDALVDAARIAARFHGGVPPPLLFTAPLPREAGEIRDASSPRSVVFGLLDDGARLSAARLALDRGNVAVFGQHGRGKTTMLRRVAQELRRVGVSHRMTVRSREGYRTVGHFDGATGGHDGRGGHDGHDDVSDMEREARRVWIVDDAGALFDPFCVDPLREEFREALDDHGVTVLFAADSCRHVRVPEQCALRVVFPTGDRASDLMHGVPGELWSSMGARAAGVPGRAVLVDGSGAFPVQCAPPAGAWEDVGRLFEENP